MDGLFFGMKMWKLKNFLLLALLVLFPQITFAVVIPKNIHFIWLGEEFPVGDIPNITDFAALNPDYRVKVWTDRPLQMSELLKYRQVSAFNIEVKRIEEIEATIPPFMLSVEVRERAGVYPNYAAASDILRLYILNHEGGIYLDTDNYPKCLYSNSNDPCEGFGDLDARKGFLFSHIGTYISEYEYSVVEVNNDRLAAYPHSAPLETLIEGMELRHRNASIDELWVKKRKPIHSKDYSRLTLTLEMTGPNLLAETMRELISTYSDSWGGYTYAEKWKNASRAFAFPDSTIGREKDSIRRKSHWSRYRRKYPAEY